MNNSYPRILKTEIPAEKYTVLILALFYTVGAAGMSFSATRPLFIMMIPFVILGSILICFFFHETKLNFKTALIFLIIASTSWLIEYAGVNTGRIFGSYSYNSGLGLSIAGTPVIIGINWLLLVYCTASLTAYLKTVQLQVTSAALLMVAYDAVLETAAPSLDMWEFDGGKVPWNNYAAWLLMALFFHTLLKLARIRIVNKVAAFVFIIQFLFFLMISIILYNLL